MPRQKQKSKQKLVLGITGSFGSGKSTVARIFRGYGAKVIDADKIARDCLKAGEPAYKKIVSFFGRGILRKDRQVDRRKLASVVFGNKALLSGLNRLTHPEIIRKIETRIRNIHSGLVILDAPLLLEAGLKNLADKIIVVNINRAKQLARIRRKRSFDKEQITARIKSQIPLSRKVRMADFVIDNSGTEKKTKSQVEHILGKMGLTRHKALAGSIRTNSLCRRANKSLLHKLCAH